MNRSKRSYYKMYNVLICQLAAVWVQFCGKANSILKVLLFSACIAVVRIHFTITTQGIQTSKRNNE